jgi:hypothetical protein
MVTAGGAARQQQLGHGRLCAGVNHLRLQACPNGVEACEPAEEFSVLYARNGPGQALRHVMVGVDHARYDHMVLCINHALSGLRQVLRGANGFNAVVANKNRGVAQFLSGIVQGGNGVGVVNEQGGHGT